MRNILIALLLFPLSLLAQKLPVDSASKMVTYREVVSQTSPKDQLYSRSRSWFAKTFTEKGATISLEDAANGHLIGKGFTVVPFRTTPFRLWFTVEVEAKDNRYRYTFTNLEIQTSSAKQSIETSLQRLTDENGNIKPIGQPMVTLIDENIKKLEASLKAALQSKSDF